ncbi:hypothetical protein [Streptomyces globosus]|uniref:hypothetical protein n=1 Tax=Streptomyces globosus TaxID=68209 RepID=UPI0031D06069
MSPVHGRGAGLPAGTPPRPPLPQGEGLALDMGSARTRIWVASRGVVLDAPGINAPDARPGHHPVGHGTIADVPETARRLDRMLGPHMPRRARPLVVVTTRVMQGPVYRERARAVVEVLRPRAVLTLSTARAAALAAHADLARPLLVADVGAHSSEVVLLVDGAVVDARSTALGTDGPVGTVPSEELGNAVAAMVRAMLRQDRTAVTAAALNRGVLLAGGGGLRPDLVPLLADGLQAPVAAVRAPHTAAVRGAARVLYAAQRHPSGRACFRTGPVRPRRTARQVAPAPPPSGTAGSEGYPAAPPAPLRRGAAGGSSSGCGS